MSGTFRAVTQRRTNAKWYFVKPDVIRWHTVKLAQYQRVGEEDCVVKESL